MTEYKVNECALMPVRKYTKERICSYSYVFKWEIENVSLLNAYLRSGEFIPFPGNCLYCAVEPDIFSITFYDNSGNTVSLAYHLTVCDIQGKIFLSKSDSFTFDGYYDDTEQEVISECIENLDRKRLPNDVLVIICSFSDDSHSRKRISRREVPTTLDYLQKLVPDLMELSPPSYKGKIELCVGNETETINKWILVAKSPVLKKMFPNLKPEKVSFIIEDIKISVVRSLVKFLNSGIIPESDTDHLCDLYSAAFKYEIAELCKACGDQLVSGLNIKNVCRILHLSYVNKDEDLKKHAISFLRDNLESVLKTDEWQHLMCEELPTAIGAIKML